MLGTAAQIVEELQTILLVEYLQSAFYARGIAAAGLIPATDTPIFATINSQHASHVPVLVGLITSKGGAAATRPVFDFTAKGALPGFAFAATQYDTFKLLAQAFEDLAVRACGGQVPRLIADKATLTDVLGIQSVEARHASEVRRLRGKKGWMTGNSRDDLPAFLQPIYAGEENATQGGVSLAALAVGFGGAEGATEAFDEPLTREQVTAIIAPFLP